MKNCLALLGLFCLCRIVGAAEELGEITAPPENLKLDSFYEKYISASGYPIVSSGNVNDYALREAAYLIDLMLANRPDVRDAMIKSGSRLLIMAHDEYTTDMPEHSHLRPKDFWNVRARGLGGSRKDPVCSCGEENLLAFEGDPYAKENILIHEFAHNIHLRGLVNVDPTFDDRLKQAYEKAMAGGLWDKKYASVNRNEYFAEGVQSWFDNNRPPDHDHNHVDTRTELKEYDPRLAALCEEVFGNTKLVYTKPTTRLTGHLAGYLPDNAPKFSWPAHLLKVQADIRKKAANRGSVREKLEAAREARQKRPNIVVIMADDLGWMDLHCQGNKRLDTPALDRLAAEGMRFTDAYAASPVCSPTRAAMMTGQAPGRLRLTNHAPGHKDGFSLDGSNLQEAESIRRLPLGYTTIAERLEEAGYATGHIGKWHLSFVARNDKTGAKEPDFRPEKQGFDLNIGGCFRGGPPSYFAPYRIPALEEKEEGEYLPERLADEAISFIQANSKKPFYLNWWPYSVHYPIQARENLIAKYSERKGPGIKDHVYAAMIEAMDIEIGRFLKALDETGLSENTLVIFKSDNGGYNGDNRPLRGFKGMLYEGGIRIPWIVRWPGKVKAGSICDTPVISMDCYPTLLEAAGLSPTPNHPVDGLSLLPLFKGSGVVDRDAIFLHYPNYAFHKRNRLGGVVREGEYKLIKRYGDGKLELYDLANDIGEKRNLARNRPVIAKKLENKLDSWLKSIDAKMPVRSNN